MGPYWRLILSISTTESLAYSAVVGFMCSWHIPFFHGHIIQILGKLRRDIGLDPLNESLVHMVVKRVLCGVYYLVGINLRQISVCFVSISIDPSIYLFLILNLPVLDT